MKPLFNTYITLFFLLLVTTTYTSESDNGVDKRIPIIAIISQPATTYQKQFPDGGDNFSEIVGSYVDYVQQTGAEAALIPFDMPWNTMTGLLAMTQGILQPGGAAELVNFEKEKSVSKYQARIHKIQAWVIEKNKKGQYYPVWGTCLGFEELMVSFSGNLGKTLQDGFDDKAKYHEVQLKDGFWKSKFFGDLDVDKKKIRSVFSKPIAYYFHSEGIDIEHFNSIPELKKEVTVLGTSKNDKGREFVAIAESKRWPIYFVQFHPEKHQFEKRRSYMPMDRSQDTIQVMTSFIFKMVQNVRKYSKDYENIPSSVQSYFPYYKTPIWSPVMSFERIYMFKNYFNLPDAETDGAPPVKSKLRLLHMIATEKRNSSH